LRASKPAAGTVAQKVVDIYTGWMDQAAIEARGTAPLQPFLDQISAVSDKTTLQKLLGSVGFSAPFGVHWTQE
jgi:endothelin-converting enzyme/putative endopeptidase